jgi:pilus assembly protein FimV
MQSAIQENDSFEFKEKLLEVFFVSGNKEEFLRYATEIKDEAVASHPGSWDNIVIMGKQLAPDESLFSGDVSAAGLDESLDFSLGSTGSVEVDSSLFQDQSEDAAGSDDVLDFNIMDPQDEGTVKEDVVDLDLNIDLPDAPVDLEEAIEDFSFDLNATLNEDVDISDSTAEVPSPLAEWDSGSSQEVHEVTELTPELAMKLESLEDNTLTAEINMADLDMDIGSATETTEAADIDLPGDSLETVSSSDMDLDISELGLSAAADAAFDVEDLADQTLDFAFDLDESDDIELTADATENSEGLSDTVLEAINSETVGATTELKLDDNFDLLLDEGSDDTANAALDMDLDNMFDSTSEADPFPDDTLQNMLPDGVSEHDSGTMQLSELNVDDRIKPSEIEEVLSADDPYASTAQITEDELAAMGLSNEGPDMNEMTGLSATLANDVDEVGTKLDLARAYIEMDDPDNAKSILQEVIEDGNDTQRKEANDILLTLS